MPQTVAFEVTVFGRVQGVGYRYFCIRVAREHGLTGWVKNNPNGSVSAWLEGNHTAVQDVLDSLKIGPASAHVSEVTTLPRTPSGEYQSFELAR